MRRAFAIVVLVLAGFVTSSPAVAQDGATSTTLGAPTQDIVPEPNTGDAPSEAGDRGGALQLGLLALVVVVIVGAVAALVRQSRRARGLA